MCRLVQRTLPQNPSLCLQAMVEEILQAYIFPRTNSAHKHNQNWWHRNMYRLLTEEIRAWRDWEVLDEGVGGSLTTHLQEVLPCCKGEQSLTFKRYQRSTVARWEPKWELKKRPKPRADNSSITPMSEITRKVWNWNTKAQSYHLTSSLWSWDTENLKTQLILCQKTLACYRRKTTSC